MPKLQITKPQPAVPYRATPVEPQPSTSTATNYQSKPISLEMFNHAATNLNKKGVINIKKYKNIFTSPCIRMNPHELVGLVGPANNFAMGGTPMHLACILLLEGKSLPEHLFLEVMVEKTQILIEFIRNHHLGLCLTANITKNTAVVWIYDNFATGNTLLLQVTVSNLPNLETQLFQLYTDIQGIVHQFMPKDDDFMPPLEDITDEEP